MKTLAELKQKKIEVDKNLLELKKLRDNIEELPIYPRKEHKIKLNKLAKSLIGLQNRYGMEPILATSEALSLGIEVCENQRKKILEIIDAEYPNILNDGDRKEFCDWKERIKEQLKGDDANHKENAPNQSQQFSKPKVDNGGTANLPNVKDADNIHTQINKEIEKDYEN